MLQINVPFESLYLLTNCIKKPLRSFNLSIYRDRHTTGSDFVHEERLNLFVFF